MLTSKNKFIWTDKPKVNFNSLIYIVNEFYSHVSKEKSRMIEFGEKIGPRIYESMNF